MHTFTSAGMLRLQISAVIAIALFCDMGLAQNAGQGKQSLPTFDVRLDQGSAAPEIKARFSAAHAKFSSLETDMAAARRSLEARVPKVQVTPHEFFGSPRVVRSEGEFLTLPAKGKNPEEVVRQFLGDNHRLFGLSAASLNTQVQTRAAYKNPKDEMQFVTLEQEIAGVPVFDAELRAAVNGNGELVSVCNTMAPRLLEDQVLNSSPCLSAEEAIVVGADHLGYGLTVSDLLKIREGEGGWAAYAPVKNVSGIVVKRVLFALAPGEAVPGFYMYLTQGGDTYALVVDSCTGSILFRMYAVARQTQTSTYEYYDYPSPAPNFPGSYTIAKDSVYTAYLGTGKMPETGRAVMTTISELPIFDDLGWINDRDETAEDIPSMTMGNNVKAYRDQIAPDGVDMDPNYSTGNLRFSTAFGSPGVNTSYIQPGSSATGRNFVYRYQKGQLWEPWWPAPEGPHEPKPLRRSIDYLTQAVTYVPESNEPYDSGSVANVFFWTNRFHDRMYELGFTEPARNFQSVNFGRGGLSADEIYAEAQDFGTQSGTKTTPMFDNVTFTFKPDGQPGKLQMYMFADCEPGYLRDAALEQDVTLHELTHGVTNRLINNAVGLSFRQGLGMGEGWSDFTALSLLSDYPSTRTESERDPDLMYPVGGWLTNRFLGVLYDSDFYGIRRWPYSTDVNVNPVTYASISSRLDTSSVKGSYYQSPLCVSRYGSEQEHNMGEVWCSMLWQVRSAVMHNYKDYGDANGYKNGNQHMLQLTVNALKITPSNPTYVDARNAILDAVCAQVDTLPATMDSSLIDPPENRTLPALDELAVWKGFIERKMGYNAKSPAGTDGTSWYEGSYGYYCQKQTITEYPTAMDDPYEVQTLSDADGGSVIMQDDGFKAIDLTDGATITYPPSNSLNSATYSKIYVSANGYVSFSQPETTNAVSRKFHFATPKISGLMADLSPQAGGKIFFRQLKNRIAVRYEDVPETYTELMAGISKCQIEIGLDNTGLAGTVRIVHLQPPYSSISHAVVGLSDGQGGEDPQSDFSKDGYYGLCNGLGYDRFTQEFIDPVNPVDFADVGGIPNTSLYFRPGTYGSGRSWSTQPVESEDYPVTVTQPAILDPAPGGNGNGVIEPGETVQLQFPVLNQYRKATISDVYVTIPTPENSLVSITAGRGTVGYDKILPGQYSSGVSPTSFEIKVDSSFPCQGTFKLSPVLIFKQAGSKQIAVGDVVLQVRSVESLGSEKTFTFPQTAMQGVLGNNVDAITTQVLLSAESAMQGGLIMKNQRTNEQVYVVSWNQLTMTAVLTRGYRYTTAQPMVAGDILDYVSIPIPDANSRGISTTVDVSGVDSIGKIDLKINSVKHTRVGDLTIKLIPPTTIGSPASKFTMMDRVPYLTGTNTTADLTNVLISDSAGIPVQSISGSLTNSYVRPTNSLSPLIGLSGNGTWTVQVIDNLAAFNGDVISWSLIITPGKTCGSSTVFQTDPGNIQPTGWEAFVFSDPAHATAAVVPGSPSVLQLHSEAADSFRVAAWRTPGVPYVASLNQIYRFNTYVYRSGQPDSLNQSQIPNMRMRTAIRFAQDNLLYLAFDPTRTDPASNAAMMALAPSSNPEQPTKYHVDFDPIDVPSLTSPTPQEVTGMVESYCMYPEEQGNLCITEASIQRFSAPDEAEGVVLRTYTGEDFWDGNVTALNYYNTNPASDTPDLRPTCTTDTLGIILDSTMVNSNHGNVSYVSSDFVPKSGGEPYIQANKMYRIRWHLNSNTLADNNPQIRLRARTIKWSFTNMLEIGSPHGAGSTNNLIAAECQPGVGTKNWLHRQGETTGGYYDQYFDSPAVLPEDVSLRRLRFGIDLIDGSYMGAPLYSSVSGRVTLDSLEVREFNQIP